MPTELDAYDRRLLALVQEDAAQTADDMARVVPLSASAIQRRLKRLREEGVIERQVAVLDPQQIGSATTLFLASLQVGQEHPERMQRLRAWLAACPQVQQAYFVTGEGDFLVMICAPDAASYEALMARLMADNSDVRRYTTSVVLSAVKRGLAVPTGE